MSTQRRSGTMRRRCRLPAHAPQVPPVLSHPSAIASPEALAALAGGCPPRLPALPLLPLLPLLPPDMHAAARADTLTAAACARSALLLLPLCRARAHAAALPPLHRGNPWLLLYSTARDGISLATLMRKADKVRRAAGGAAGAGAFCWCCWCCWRCWRCC
jgi:hypothetical protein